MYPDGEGPGCIEINEATFLGIKQYGYTFEKDNKLIEKSVFAGIPRDSLSYEQIVELSEGKTLESTSKLRFYKSFSSLNIKIKEITVKIKRSNDKKLVGNKYMPIHVNVRSRDSIINKMLKILKKLNNNLGRTLKNPILVVIQFLFLRLLELINFTVYYIGIK